MAGATQHRTSGSVRSRSATSWGLEEARVDARFPVLLLATAFDMLALLTRVRLASEVSALLPGAIFSYQALSLERHFRDLLAYCICYKQVKRCYRCYIDNGRQFIDNCRAYCSVRPK